MLFRLWVSILFSHSEIDNMDDIGSFCSRTTNQEIIGLDISVDEIFFVDCLDAGEL